MKDDKFEMILVSLDFKERLETKVYPFLEKKGIQSRVVLLNDSKANKWIDRIDPEWSGAIPITLILRGEQREFYEQEFHSTDELRKIVEPFLKLDK